MRTMLITDGSFNLEKLEIACRAGIDAVQLREKEASTRTLLAFGSKLRLLTWEYGTQLIVNERIDIALAIKADGVHLPEDSLSPQVVKKLHLKAGMSVHSLESALRAQEEGADYVMLSSAPLKVVATRLKIPIYAVGEVTPSKIPGLLQEGAYGVAAISALLHTSDIATSVTAFKAHFSKSKVKGLLVILSSVELAKQVIQEGADAIQFRHKGPYTREHFLAAQQIAYLCKEANLPFLINDRADLALALDASGVHLGQTDLPLRDTRKILGTHKLIGGTASTLEEALLAESYGADYLGLGHIFPTQSKQKDYPPIGLEMISKVKAKTQIPIIAIGGINEDNVQSVIQAGADGVAVISAAIRTKELKKRMMHARS
jgi:thiamine-phosphate pyrophosphorylase